MDKCVCYTPSLEEWSSVARSKAFLCEIWKGIPDLDFITSRSATGHEALKVEGDELYVWIHPSVVKRLKQAEPMPFLKAFGRRLPGEKINFILVEEAEDGNSLEEMISWAKDFNGQQLTRAQRRRARSAT